MLVPFILITIAVVYFVMGRIWESRVERPKINKNNLPPVSILIANYKNNIERTLKSVSSLDYPNKEVIVVNDSQDNKKATCEKYGAKYIQNEKRIGKAMSLNKAAKIARGELLFFLDADTEVSKDCLLKLAPWFKKENVGAVTPKNMIRGLKENILTKLSSLDGYFVANLLKTHMFFGSLLSFRGCSVLVRRRVFEEIEGFKNTMTEDIDFSARVLRHGYKIYFDPEAVTTTEAPNTLSSLSKQRYRWGKGAMFSFMRHFPFYIKNPQFLIYTIPYVFAPIAFFGLFILNTHLYILPLLSLYLMYTLSFKEFMFLVVALTIPMLPIFTMKLTATGTAGMAHMLIFTYSEKQDSKDILYIVPYLFFYVPLITIFYAKGIIRAFIDKIRGRPELNLNEW